MPLAYTTTKDDGIPDTVFNSDDIAALMVQGTRYSGMWVLNMHDTPSAGQEPELFKTIQTEQNPDRQMALDTIVIWANDIAVKNGWKMAFKDLSEHYGPESLPFFVGAAIFFDRRSDSV